MMSAALSLSIMNNNAIARQRESDAEYARKTANKTQADLEKEFQFRQALIKDINQLFDEMEATLNCHQQNETMLEAVYSQLSRDLAEFKKVLITECAWVDTGYKRPLLTAEKLKQTLETVLNTTTSMEVKNNAVTQFRNEARNGKYSCAMKYGIAAMAGALVFGALFFGLLIGLGFPFFAWPILTGLVIFKGLALMGMGACVAARPVDDLCKGQDDTRGREVTARLNLLVKNRSMMFAEKPVVKSEESVVSRCRVG